MLAGKAQVERRADGEGAAWEMSMKKKEEYVSYPNQILA